MQAHEILMNRCFELAGKFSGFTAPNPLVGAVIVYNGEIIAEGAHELYGGPHAEVNAIRKIKDESVLPQCTLYVNLEPCSHHGKTPPCADLIVEKKIGRVVICNTDPNPLVAGRGIEKLRKAGIEVITGVLNSEGYFLNRRFFTFHEKKRPYIILKWAESQDGFVDHDRSIAGNFPARISGQAMNEIVHRWRSEEAAILIGSHTALLDDPLLTVRLASGKNPARIVIDPQGKIPPTAKVFNGEATTLIFTEKTDRNIPGGRIMPLEAGKDALPQIMQALYEQQILSVMVEGGPETQRRFYEAGYWDEIRRIVSPLLLKQGTAAPAIDMEHAEYFGAAPDRCYIRYREERRTL